MSYAELSQPFRVKKAEISINMPANMNKSLGFWDNKASTTPYSFLAQNNSLIEQEFQDLFAVLKKHDKEIQLIDEKIQKLSAKVNNEAIIAPLEARKKVLVSRNAERKDFWLNCYYYSRMLESYNNAYGKANKYGQWSEEIRLRFNDSARVPPKERKEWTTRILNDLTELASTPWHISKIRDWISFANVYRIHTVFCRLAAKGFLTIAAEQKLLDSLKAMLGFEVNIAILDAPTNVYNVLSVGLFAVRFIIQTGMLAKHVFMPSDKEKDNVDEHWSEHAYDRFIAELNKRYCSMLNDVVWANVNLFSNYANYFKLSSGFANWLTAGFLCFDIALTIWRRRLDQYDYQVKKQQYLTELGVQDVSELGDIAKLDVETQILAEQLMRLEIRWDAKNAMYWFDVAAACVLATSLTVALLVTSVPIVTPLCFLMITIGASMYITDGKFQAYQEKRYELQRMPMEASCIPEYKASVEEELNAAWFTFWSSLLKNATIPLFITAAFTVSAPMALVLAGLYIAYECGHDYFERSEPFLATLLIAGACAVSWPLALSVTALYLGYEAGRWLLDESEPDVLATPRPF